MIFTIGTVSQLNFKESLFTYLSKDNRIEDILSIVIEYGYKGDKDYSQINENEFRLLLNEYYDYDSQILFDIVGLMIKASVGLEDDFESITSYNLDWLDWKKENPNDTYDDFYNTSYNYLGDVKVYIFRSMTKICFIHIGYDDFMLYEQLELNVKNLQAQIEEYVLKIESEE